MTKIVCISEEKYKQLKERASKTKEVLLQLKKAFDELDTSKIK